MKPTHWIFSFDQDVMNRLSRISIDILGDTQLSGLWVDLKEGVFVLLLKAIRQRIVQCAELKAVCICGNNLKGREIQVSLEGQ